MSINVTVTETPNVDLTVTTATGINLDVNNPTHNSLDGIQGGQQGEYYHLTASQYASLDQPNITTATIVDALGYTPLSTETDDQTLDEVLAQGNTSTRDISVANISGSGVFSLKGDTSSQLDISTNTFGAFIHPKGGSYNILYLNSAAGDVRLAQTSVNNKLSLWDNSAQQKVIIASNGNSHFGGGNVGIGTSSPQQKLHVEGTIRIGSDVDLTRYAGQLYTAQNIVLGSPNSETANITVNASQTKSVLGVRRPSSGTVSILKVRDYSAQDLYVDIDSDGNGYFAGNVGIGTTSPSQKLEVAGQSRFGTNNTITATAAANTLVVESASSTQGGVSILGPATAYQYLAFGSPSDSLGALARWKHNDSTLEIGTSSTDGQLIFLAANSSEKMRINSSGNVGIGTTSPSWKLHVSSTTRAAILGNGTPWKSDGVAFIGSYYGTHTPLLVDHHNASTNSSNFAEFRNGDDDITIKLKADGSADFAGDLAVNGGDITLNGTATSTLTIDTSNSFGRELTFSTNGILPTISANSDLLIKTSNNDTQIKLEGGGSTDNIQFIANEFEQVRITTAGVGIGTTSPSSKLHAYQTLSTAPSIVSRVPYKTNADAQLKQRAALRIDIDEGGSSLSIGGIGSAHGGFIQSYSTNSTSAHRNFVLNPFGGNVGIGFGASAAPTEKLDVVGNIKASGFINYAAKTVAETNAMTGMVAGSSVYVTDETGGSVMATYDGTNWRRSTDRAIIS